MPHDLKSTLGTAALRSLAFAVAMALAPAGGPAFASANVLRAGTAVGDRSLVRIVVYSGNVTVRQAAGSSVDVAGSVRGEAAPVDLRLNQTADATSITICPARAAVSGSPSACDDPQLKSVQIDLAVAVPANVRLDVSVRNGNVKAVGIANEVHADTVNGNVAIGTRGYAAATTRNGNIDVSMSDTAPGGPLEFTSTNGTITLRLSPASNARLYAASKTGNVQVAGAATFSTRSANFAEGAIGNGSGVAVRAVTENGNVRISL